MRGIGLTGLAVAALLSSGVAIRHADAMTLAPASPPGGANAAVLQRVANVCGTNGCVRVQTQRVHHQKPGSVAAHHI